MKKKYNIKTLVVIITIVFINTIVNSQVRIVQVDPSANTAVLHNFGGTMVDINGYWLCTHITYQQLSTMTIQGSLMLAAGADVTVTTTTIAMIPSGGDLGLYNAFNFGSSTAMQDFLQWNGSFPFPAGRENVAVAKGIWSSGTFISVGAQYQYIGDGAQNGVTFWQTVLSVDEFNKLSFKIYPNPSDSVLNFQLPNNIKKGTLEVYDILGKQILSKPFETNSILEINVSNLNKGFYLAKITLGRSSQTKPFIKK